LVESPVTPDGVTACLFEIVTPRGVGVALKLLLIQVSCPLFQVWMTGKIRVSTQHHVMEQSRRIAAAHDRQMTRERL